jgi:cyclic pyranopterin phosphate synthase
MFCDSCNRLRLTSDGKIRPCLYSAHSFDMKKLLRDGADDSQILEAIDRIISKKRNFTKLNSFTEEFSMRNIGG